MSHDALANTCISQQRCFCHSNFKHFYTLVLPDGQPHAVVPDKLGGLQRHLGAFITEYCNNKNRKLPVDIVKMGEKFFDDLTDFLVDYGPQVM
jgi:hypothetical protein